MKDNQSQKKDQYYVWRLMGRKLAGNASKNELQELQELLVDNPHIQYSMEILSRLSDPGKGSNGDVNGDSGVPPQDKSTLGQGRERLILPQERLITPQDRLNIPQDRITGQLGKML